MIWVSHSEKQEKANRRFHLVKLTVSSLQIDGLLLSKSTISSSEVVNFRASNRRFALSGFQKQIFTIPLLLSRDSTKGIIKGLKIEISVVKILESELTFDGWIFTFFITSPCKVSMGSALYLQKEK